MAGAPKGAPSILFVDDEEAILAALRSLFRKEGYSITLCGSGEEALAHLAAAPADVIVSDLRMPGMTGIEFLNRAGAVCPTAVRIMLSGYEDKGVVLESLGKGLARHYVMKPWEDAPFRALVAQAIRLLRGLHEQRLREILGSLDRLPAPPRFHHHLTLMLANADVSIREIEREVEKNPPVVAQLLRVANSVYYGSRKPVTSVHDAVIFVGTEYVASLVAAIEAFHSLGTVADQSVMQVVDQLWTRALRRATIAKNIAERWEGLRDRNIIYVSSLLQDIGLVVRACTDPESMAYFLSLTEKGKTPFLEADARVFGITHDEVGAALLEYWNLPAEIVTSVARHHAMTGIEPLVQVMQIAEALEGSSHGLVLSPGLRSLVDTWSQRLQPILSSLAS
jgi:HD-like signal output (HDOD) protein